MKHAPPYIRSPLGLPTGVIRRSSLNEVVHEIGPLLPAHDVAIAVVEVLFWIEVEGSLGVKDHAKLQRPQRRGIVPAQQAPAVTVLRFRHPDIPKKFRKKWESCYVFVIALGTPRWLDNLPVLEQDAHSKVFLALSITSTVVVDQLEGHVRARAEESLQ